MPKMTRAAFLRSAFAAAAAYALGGCATAKQLTREVLKAHPKTRRFVREWDRYSRIAHILRKYHDKGNLNDQEVVEILYISGVIKKAPPKMRRPRKGRRTKPFPVPRYKGAWRWPLKAGVVSSEFGKRWGGYHNGIDIAADKGKPIYAAAPGEVAYSGSGLRGYGNVVFLRHDQSTISIYAHNKRNKVRKGQKVKRGQLIALLGSTGRSTGPHIHFEIRKGKKSVNPRKVLPKSRF